MRVWHPMLNIDWMSKRGAHTKNISLHSIIGYHPYTWEHYSQYNKNNRYCKKKYLPCQFSASLVDSCVLFFSGAKGLASCQAAALDELVAGEGAPHRFLRGLGETDRCSYPLRLQDPRNWYILLIFLPCSIFNRAAEVLGGFGFLDFLRIMDVQIPDSINIFKGFTNKKRSR